MTWNFLGQWWRSQPDSARTGLHTSTRRLAPKSFFARPQLEALEDRWVPSAIRNIAGFTANTLAANDDGSTGAVNVGFTFNFFGVQTNQVFVNNNGNITLSQPLAQFTPTALNGPNNNIPIIAPFFADVDTRGAGSGLVTYGTTTLCGRPAFGVDYINVGYYQEHANKLDSFQVILVDRSDIAPGDFDIEFNYGNIQWETGDASGGTNGLGGSSARVGYSNGTGNPGTFDELTGSGVNGAFLNGGPDALIEETQMSTTPGQLHFLVRNGQVITPMPTVNDDVTGNSRVFYPLRYIYDSATGDLEGNLTIVNVTPPNPSAATDACLGIVMDNTVFSTTFNGPINAVYPAGSNGTNSVTNATGTTQSGGQYLTAHDTPSLPTGSVTRIRVSLSNPSHATPSSFFLGEGVQVFAGPFNPAVL